MSSLIKIQIEDMTEVTSVQSYALLEMAYGGILEVIGLLAFSSHTNTLC